MLHKCEYCQPLTGRTPNPSTSANYQGGDSGGNY